MSGNRAAKREFNPISLSFLDVMSCGFGAVVLIFLILDHSTSVQTQASDPELMAEINLLNDEINDGEANLVRIRNTVSDVDYDMVEAQGLARSIQQEIDDFLEELAQLENTTLARQESVEKLKSDIQSLEEELERLRAAQDSYSGNFVRPYVGDGNRQYLTGLILGGSRILVLVDTSARCSITQSSTFYAAATCPMIPRSILPSGLVYARSLTGLPRSCHRPASIRFMHSMKMCSH